MLSDPQIHYLDNAATTRVDPAVTEVIHDALVELWANPSSLYDPAVAAQDGIETARARIAKTLHCRSDEFLGVDMTVPLRGDFHDGEAFLF